jgi:hypothetical protein
MNKSTIYFKSGFGNIVKLEVKLLGHGTKKYAQYSAAPFVQYIKKRARKPTGFIQTYRPNIVIVDGWGHPEPDSMFLEPEISSTGLAVSKGRYTAFDESWQNDFDLMFDKYVNNNDNVEVIADYREFDSMNEVATTEFAGYLQAPY